MKSRVAILLSGRGSNFLALHRAMAEGGVAAEIVLVVSDRPDAHGLTKARELGLRAEAIDRKGLRRATHEGKVLKALEEVQPDWICLAGYMRVLSAHFVRAHSGKILNIHPSLLPAFPGLDAQAQALEHGVRVSGCTVHLVDEGLDSGPIVVQRSVEVWPGDTRETLSARILAQEHRAYAEALSALIDNEWAIEGRRLVWS